MSARATKTPSSWDSLFFSTPELKVVRYLVSSKETSYSLRVLVSKLKGVRGLGGIQGLEKILERLEESGIVNFIDNRRGVRIQDEHPTVAVSRRLWAMCDIEGLSIQLQAISSKGVMLAVHPAEIQLFVVTEQAEECKKLTEQYPLGKLISLTTQSRDQFDHLQKQDSKLYNQVSQGNLLWGSSW
jgi:hypothetical protein